MFRLFDLLNKFSFRRRNGFQQQWRPVLGLEGLYEVNEYGSIRSLHKRNKQPLLLKQSKDGAGYLRVNLRKNGTAETINIHKIVALAFVPNPECKEQINHKDGNKLNNHYINLEWCTCKENIRHSFALGLVPRKRKPVINTCTGELFSYAKEAASHYEINLSTIRGYLSGAIKSNPYCLKYIDV